MANTARENILNRIKKALLQPVPLPFPDRNDNETLYVQKEHDLNILFEQEFIGIQGNFVSCNNDADLKLKLKGLIDQKGWSNIYFTKNKFDNQLIELGLSSSNDLANCHVSITDCESLVARTGTMVLSAAQASGRTTSVYAPIHICIAHASQIVYDVKDALEQLNTKHGQGFPSFVTFATGPSRTADIEKTLVTGVHGPKEVYCFLVLN
jgi:L-lactate dehydrogenase complex protein LldG